MNYSIDILLATYNGDKYLSEQINSILSQTILEWKLIIRDDGSTDKTVQIINHYVKTYPDKITQIVDTDKNLGVTHNFERLMKYSTAPYIMFCDQDDIWQSDKIKISFSKIKMMEEQYGTDVPLLVYTDLAVCDEEGMLIKDSFWKYQGADPSLPKHFAKALIQNNATGNTFIFNRALLQKALPFSEEAVMHDWWVALVALYLGKIDYVADQTLFYRQHGTNVSGDKGRNILPMFRKLPYYCTTLEKNSEQAKSFLENFRPQLDQNTITILEAFITLFYVNRFLRVYKLFKFRFLTLRNPKDIGKVFMVIACPKKECL